jgi:flavodoxin
MVNYLIDFMFSKIGEDNMKVGIVYYSRTGNTRHAAGIIESKLKEQKTDVAFVEIEHLKKPGFLKAGRSVMAQKELPIKNTDFNLKKYDFILVGSPTWAGRAPPYIKTFMSKAENVKGKKAAIFNTGMTPINNREQVIQMIKDELVKIGLSTIDNTLTLKMKKQEILDGEQNIDEFVSKIKTK